MYLAARAWGIQPSEFWEMTMGEWMLEAGMHMEQAEAAPKVPGKLSASEVDRLAKLLPVEGA